MVDKMTFYGKINFATGQTPDSTSVGNTTTEIVAANTSRKWIVLTNVGNKDIFIACDVDALVDKGMLLGKAGGSVLMGADLCTTGAIDGITSAGTSTVIFQEGN